MSAAMRRAAVALVLAWAGAAAGAAHALTVSELQRLLQARPRQAVAFQEVRESPWLAAPVTSSGTLHATPQALEKRVASPRRETWRMLSDRLEWIGPDGSRKQILFSQAPALAALADLMRRALSGDIAALERDFKIQLQGDAQVWSAQLTPRSPELARHLESVELQGSGGALQVLIVSERQGERTTTRLQTSN